MQRRFAPMTGIVCFSLVAMAGTPMPHLPSAQPSVREITAARVFEEPLVPVGGEPTGAENAALWGAIRAYQAGTRSEDVSPFLAFLKAYPASPWRPALQMDLGIVYRRTGYFTHALTAWQEAWDLTKALHEPNAQPIGDRAGSELSVLLARLGRVPQLKALLKELDQRKFRGSASEKVASAKESLAKETVEPEMNFRCGPLSLASIRVAQHKPEPRLSEERCTPNGTSLAHNVELAAKYKMDMQAAFRAPGSKVLVPSMVHWKAGHFAAVVKEDNGRFLVQDPTFTDDIWVSREALDEEGSGYALVPGGPLPKGWRAVDQVEAGKVWGRGGAPFGTNKSNGKKDPQKGDRDCKGMARHSFHSMIASLYVNDEPVGYVPPIGPSVLFHVSYSQREESQPQTFTYGNLGPKWTFEFLSYIQDDPTVAIDTPTVSMTVDAYNRGGGLKPYTFSGAKGADVSTSTPTGPSLPQVEDGSFLVRTNINSYVRIFQDGSQEVFDLPDGARSFPRKVFLTKVVDPIGSTLTLAYDAQFRLTTITDAQGKATTLSYGLPSDPLKVTKVTDPFGRFATFEYNDAGQLSAITDVVGIRSEFSYGPTSDAPSNPIDFMNALTTPYGTHRYYQGADSDSRWVEAEDPLGNRQRMEFRRHPGSAAQNTPLPPGFTAAKPGGSFYWDKQAMALYPRDYNRADHTRWVITYDGDTVTGVPLCLKPAGSDTYTTWFTYPGQADTRFEGTFHSPARILKDMGNGQYQEFDFEYNALGRVTKSVDPMGRETSFVYADNLQDLLEVRQTSHGRNDLLAKYTYNDHHMPLTATDAAGQTTTLAYNAANQITSITNPLGQATAITYNPLGQMVDITVPGGRTTSFTYDAIGRVHSVTSPEGDTLTTDYDALDRPVKVTYPDGTFEAMTYNALDVATRRSRNGKQTRFFYNAVRQLTDVEDALGRITHFDWCGCGSLEALTDPMGKVTTWLHDLDGRVVGKLLPDGGVTTYGYDLLGRLKQRLDAKGQITNYDYNLDNSLNRVSYANTLRPEPETTYQYDPDFNRLTKVSRNGQTMAYGYNPIASMPSLGAGRLASVAGPLPSDVITYAYDALGRVNHREVKGNASDVGFDDQGRVSRVTNPLGAFQYGYEGNTGRLSSVLLPNGMNTTFDYYGSEGEHRLKDIQHKTSTGDTVSSFAYTYDPDGQIKTWTQSTATASKTYQFGYDAVGQLLSATLTSGNGAVLRNFLYGYDASGNRTTETVDGQTTTAVFNEANQLLSTRSSDNNAPIRNAGGKTSPARSRQAKPAHRSTPPRR